MNRCVVAMANLAPRKMRLGSREGMGLSTDTVDGGSRSVHAPEALEESSRPS